MQATKIKTDLAKNQTTQDKLNEALAADKEKLQDAQNRISALRAQIAERQTLVERKQRIDHECGEIAVYLGSRRGGLMTAGTFLIWQVQQLASPQHQPLPPLPIYLPDRAGTARSRFTQYLGEC